MSTKSYVWEEMDQNTTSFDKRPQQRSKEFVILSLDKQWLYFIEVCDCVV